MFLKCSSNFRHPPSLLTGFRRFPISRLSSGTMRMLRLPSSFSFPSVSLGTDTTLRHAAFLLVTTGAARFLCNLVLCSSGGPCSASLRVETVGSPVFPCLPLLTLICSPTPTRLPYLTIYDTSVLPLDKYRSEAPVNRYFRGSIHTFISHCLRFVPALLLTTQDSLPVGG